MKKLILLLSAITYLSFISTAQTGNERNFDSVYNVLRHTQESKNVLKSTQEIKYLPDTVIFYKVSGTVMRYTYTYDSNGNRLSDLCEKWTNNNWINYYRNTYTYDSNGNLLSYSDGQWTNNAWENSNRRYYTYDSNGNQLTELYEYLTLRNTWEKYSRETYTYDSKGNRLSCLREKWTNNNWSNDYKYTYTYDSNGNQLTDLSGQWTNYAWRNSNKKTFTYDSGGNRLTALSEQWTNNAWEIYGRITATYDSKGNQLTYLEEYWIDYAYRNGYRGTFTYDSNGNQLTKLSEKSTNNAWVNYYRYSYTYDLNGNKLSGEYYNWNSTNNNWEQTEDEYDWEIFSNNKYFDEYSGFKVKVHWKALDVTGIKQITENNKIEIYPNPCIDQLIIQNEELGIRNEDNLLRISDLQGRTVLQQKLMQGQTAVDVSQLKSGFYIVEIGKWRRKIVKR